MPPAIMAWHCGPVLAQFEIGRFGNDWRCIRDARGENVHGDMAVGPQPRHLPGWSCSVELRARHYCYPSDGPSNRHGDAPGRAQSRSRTPSIRRSSWWLSSSRRGRRRGQSPVGDLRACPGKKSEDRGLGWARNSAQRRVTAKDGAAQNRRERTPGRRKTRDRSVAVLAKERGPGVAGCAEREIRVGDVAWICREFCWFRSNLELRLLCRSPTAGHWP